MKVEKVLLILVVEDNADDEMLSVRFLKKEAPEAQIVVARDGEEALRCLEGPFELDGQAFDEAPDFILLDLKLPKKNGDSVLKELRACPLTACTPIVMFTSSDEPHDVVKCYNAGANTYVIKPVDIDAYRDAVKSIATFWFNFASLPTTCVAPVRA